MSLDATRRKLIFDSIALGVAGAASLPLLAEPVYYDARCWYFSKLFPSSDRMR